MYRYYCEIDEDILTDIQKYEEQQFLKFKSKFDCLCLKVSRLYGWNYAISVHRWIDTENKQKNKLLDGYTATLQVDITDANGNMIEIDENKSTFFENITYVSFIPILRKYRVFQNEKLKDIQAEIKQFIRKFEKHL